jgi:glucose-1-phosphate adenylyltransferase
MLTEGFKIHLPRSEIRSSDYAFIADGVHMSQTILMGADYYDDPGVPPLGGIPLGIGPNCQIEGAIIDKNVRMGEGVTICPFPRGRELDAGSWVVQDGIVVIPKNTVLHPGTYIGPD